MTPLRLEAPAKVNLSLRVVGRRNDGYHELVTDLVLLELADRLLLMPGCSGLRVEHNEHELPVTADQNLAWRGLAWGMGEDPVLACLTLEKRVPVAAGLGGGSSDAAAGWRLGRRWAGLPERPVPAELEDLSHIGADVPFFAAGVAAARVEGIGELVTPLDPVGGEVLLVDPGVRLSTAAVFAELRPSDWSSADAAERSHNDLLAPARRLRPELDDVFRLVGGAGAEPRLTGSGPIVYCLSDDAERLDAVAARLDRAGLRLTRTRTRLEAASIEAVVDEQEEAPA